MGLLLDKQKTNKIAILILSVLLIIAALSVKQFEIITKFDLQGIHFVQKIFSKLPVSIPIFISDFGYEQYMFVPLFIVGVIFAFKKKFREFFMLVFMTEISYLLVFFIKLLVQRLRPPLELQLIQETGFSFPSGHSTVAACFYGLLILLVFKYIKNPWVKYLLVTICILIILSVGMSRIWLGVHYPTDVLSGFILGSLLVLVASTYNK